MLYVIRIFLLLSILISVLACKKKSTLFVVHEAEKTGIDFANVLTETEDLNILTYLYYYNGGGVSAADFNNDGLTDLYFTGNQTADKLYLNQGNFVFKDITDIAGIENASNWTTGVTTVDINHDGLLDIYVCKVSAYKNLKGHNLLYVNQGIVDGSPKFKEESAKYNLDFQGFSTQGVFFDYDLDQDLDLFLLNHSVHPNRNYGNGKKRLEIDSLSGDKLFENIEGRFVDVSSKAGIFQGKIGYGLGVSIGDMNQDGYPDIYVGNDFFENDYLYINQQNKTFLERISEDSKKLGHTSHFSMGNAMSDMNNDGLMDILSLDMLPDDIKTYKTSGLEAPYQNYAYYLKNGYAPQYMQNTLHLNLGKERFSEVAFLSGIAASEWSWSPLVADFDNDGDKDIYITNGILGATNDMDFVNFISNEKIQRRIDKGMSQEDLSFIKELPQKKTPNTFFRNKGAGLFEDISDQWTHEKASFSNGAIYADLDNDGDLDVVVNNVNEKAVVLENKTNSEIDASTYLSLKFKGVEKNTYGIGTKVFLFNEGKLSIEENFPKGYLSATEPRLHLGLYSGNTIDSLLVVWPGGKYQLLKELETSQQLLLQFKDAAGNYYQDYKKTTKSYLKNLDTIFPFKHNDDTTIEFNRDPLVPYASTNLGPGLSVGDVNNDGLEDVFVGGGKTQGARLFLQAENGSFSNEQAQTFLVDAINEDIAHTFFDANNDGYKDLIVLSGGNEFKRGKPLQPRLYWNREGVFIKDTLQFTKLELNASSVRAVDIDNDGDLDLNMGVNLVPWQFGASPQQYIFENNGLGQFKDITASYASDLQGIGNVEDLFWIDLNNDGYQDLIAVGHWMPISIFINNGKKLTLQRENKLGSTQGWWNTVKAGDFDKDGDIDLVVGNWGLNTRLQATEKEPIQLYSHDFDENGSVEPLISYFYKGVKTPFASKDELVKQMPFLNKKYLSYAEFAKTNFETLFSKKKLKEAKKKEVFELATCYFENTGNNKFQKHLLPFMAQVSQVNDIAIDDFNNDGFFDILLTGNNYEISTQLGRFDASHGVLMLNDTNGFFREIKNQEFFISGPARNIEKILIQGVDHFIITMNNEVPVIVRKDN